MHSSRAWEIVGQYAGRTAQRRLSRYGIWMGAGAAHVLGPNLQQRAGPAAEVSSNISPNVAQGIGEAGDEGVSTVLLGA